MAFLENDSSGLSLKWRKIFQSICNTLDIPQRKNNLQDCADDGIDGREAADVFVKDLGGTSSANVDGFVELWSCRGVGRGGAGGAGRRIHSVFVSGFLFPMGVPTRLQFRLPVPVVPFPVRARAWLWLGSGVWASPSLFGFKPFFLVFKSTSPPY